MPHAFNIVGELFTHESRWTIRGASRFLGELCKYTGNIDMFFPFQVSFQVSFREYQISQDHEFYQDKGIFNDFLCALGGLAWMIISNPRTKKMAIPQ